MKTITILLLSTTFSFAQVQIDKPLQLTGSGMDARIEGIDTVAHAKDAVNVATLQSGRLNYAVATGSGGVYQISLPFYTGEPYEGMEIKMKANHTTISDTTYIMLNGSINRTEDHLVAGVEKKVDIPAGKIMVFIFDGLVWQRLGSDFY